MNPKMSNLESKMGDFFGVFGSQNRPQKAPGAQLGAKTEILWKKGCRMLKLYIVKTTRLPKQSIIQL